MRSFPIVTITLAVVACTDATTTTPANPPDGADQASLGVSVVPSGYSVPLALGFLPGGLWSEANAINNLGQIVGTSGLMVNGAWRSHAFRYTAGGGMVDLGTLPGGSDSYAYGINQSGQVVGMSMVGDQWRAFRFDPLGGMQDIHSSLAKHSVGRAINASGTVVGAAEGASSFLQAFRWTPSTGMVFLSSEPSEARDVNDGGTIVGELNFVAHKWVGSTPTSLGTLGGPYSSAYATNNTGVIVGWSEISLGPYWLELHGFQHMSNTMSDLGSLHWRYFATDVSDKGRIVGFTDNFGDERAFTWYQGQFSYLPVFKQGAFTKALAVNNCGTVVGQAEDTAGNWVAVRWVRRVCD